MTDSHGAQRPGAVLVVVVVVLLMVSLAIIGLIEMTQSEWQATKFRSRELVLENHLLSGENYLLAIAELSNAQRRGLQGTSQISEWFAHQVVTIDGNSQEDPSFSLLPMGTFSFDGELAFGYTNESAKLNLKQLLEWEQKYPGFGEQALLELPGMTPEAAASIMDWLDADSDPRPLGAEGAEYREAQRLREPANGLPVHLEELTQVIHTSLDDWYQESTAGESESGAPKSRSQEFEHPGWLHFLTLHSRERNESFSGESRINLNDTDLTRLHQRLSQRLGPGVADFVVAYRQFGPTSGRIRSRPQPAPARGAGNGKLDLSQPARFQFESELGLIGTAVLVRRGNLPPQRLESPFPADRQRWGGQLQAALDQVTVDARPTIEGRVNILEASREVLRMVPGLDPLVVDQIVNARGWPSDASQPPIHPVWLLEQGLVDLESMKRLMPLLTTGGDVLSANIVAVDPFYRIVLREQAMFDGSDPARGRLYCKDLRDHPLPFSVDQLIPEKSRRASLNQ